MKSNPYAQAEAWEAMTRVAVMGFLFLGALMALSSAIVISVLETSEGAKILQAALLIFGFSAFATALAIKKAERLSWKHWCVISILAAPGAVYTLCTE